MTKKRGFTLIELPVVRKRGFTLIELPVVRKRGFTLIELLVVIFIVGLLASLIIVNVSNARATARDGKRIANLKAVQTALEMYNQTNREYPNTYSERIYSYNDGRANDDWVPSLKPTYLPVLPRDPKNNETWRYVYRSDGKDYLLIAFLENICGTKTSDSCNTTSVQELSRHNQNTNVDDNSIALYSSGAVNHVPVW